MTNPTVYCMIHNGLYFSLATCQFNIPYLATRIVPHPRIVLHHIFCKHLLLVLSYLKYLRLQPDLILQLFVQSHLNAYRYSFFVHSPFLWTIFHFTVKEVTCVSFGLASLPFLIFTDVHYNLFVFVFFVVVL